MAVYEIDKSGKRVICLSDIKVYGGAEVRFY
jgi:hypothetical protein